ncbi:Gfo/Idh/MocA family oxidoreductase [Mollicutes bacterium LVI A0039]|nr:Gfo/Idh/MocA family oxidoreductase [Mollicutes bacterium LVI A0039]
MKVGFIGFGKSVHRYHMPFIDMIPEIEVVGYYARGLTTFEMPYPKTAEFKRFSTVEELLETDINLVIICTSALHYEFAKMALNSNKHVLCEKPLCDTLAQTTELYAIASERNLVLCPYQNRRFDHDFVEVFAAIDQGLVGEVAEIVSSHTQDRFVPSNIISTKYNGLVYGHAVHFIDQIVSRYGEPDHLLYDIANQRDYLFNGAGTIDDYYHIVLIYGQLRVSINFNAIAVKAPPRFTVYGSAGTIEKYGIDRQEHYLKQGIYADNPKFGARGVNEETMVYQVNGDIINYQTPIKFYDQFYHQLRLAVNNGTPPPVSEFEAKVVINIMETVVNGRPYKKIGK